MKILQILERRMLFENFKLAQKEFSMETNNSSDVAQTLNTFRNRQSRIQDPNLKDINYWRKQGFEKFKEFVHDIDVKHDSKRTRRASVKASAHDILTIKKTDNIHLFIPLSKAASCFYGVKGTHEHGGWCISTLGEQNHFSTYTNNGMVICFLIHENEIYALVVNPSDSSIVECQDKYNKGFDPKKFLEIANITINELFKFISQHHDDIERAYFDNNTSTPAEVYNHAKRKRKRLPEKEYIVAKDPDYSLFYARNIINGRFPEGEKAIAKDPECSYLYARNIINGRFPEGEKAIAQNPEYSYIYARNVLNGRFPEGEKAIAKDPEYSYHYARNVLNGRFPEGEKAIAQHSGYSYMYARKVLNGRFLKGEEVMAEEGGFAAKKYVDEFPDAKETIERLRAG